MQSTVRVSLVLGALTVALTESTGIEAQRAPVVDTAATSAVQVITRERIAERETSLLTLIRTTPQPFNQVRITLPSDKRVNAGYLPDGWTHQQKGKQLRLSGPALYEARLRFDIPNSSIRDYENEKTLIQMLSDTWLPGEYEAVIRAGPRVSVTPNLEGIFTAPPYGTPGYPLTIGVGDNYRDGRWRFKLQGGSTWPIVAPEEVRAWKETPEAVRDLQQTRAEFVDFLLGLPTTRPRVTMFPDRPISGVTYTDPWGETLVDAPFKIDVAQRDASCTPRLTGGTQFAFAGQAACVSGCFPDYKSAYGLTLNSSLKVSPWAFSPTAVMLGIPGETPPGSYTIGGPDITGTVTVGILSLEGSIDTNSLWRGQSTTMRLRIVGTDQKLPIVVLNRTPGIITVEGGEHQTITTPGGADNAVTRSVRGIHKGDFQIVYSLNLPGCGK